MNELQQSAEAAGCKLGIVDLEKRSWYLPTTKNQRDHVIHLSDFAVEQFRSLRPGPQIALGSWVFPATHYLGPIHVKSLGKQLADRQRGPEARLRGRTQNTQALVLPGGRWTAHDLRRTAATRMADLGVSGDVIDECLNHVSYSRMARVYVRSRRLKEQAQAFEILGAWLASLPRDVQLERDVAVPPDDALSVKSALING
jgi:integrase